MGTVTELPAHDHRAWRGYADHLRDCMRQGGVEAVAIDAVLEAMKPIFLAAAGTRVHQLNADPDVAVQQIRSFGSILLNALALRELELFRLRGG